MYEYKRIESRIGKLTPKQFINLLNEHAKQGWELFSYNEHEGLNYNYRFTAIMKMKIIN